jgi:hypothetical protein
MKLLQETIDPSAHKWPFIGVVSELEVNGWGGGENFSSTVNIIHMYYVTTAMQEFIALNGILHQQQME